jgi:hypothetical protein
MVRFFCFNYWIIKYIINAAHVAQICLSRKSHINHQQPTIALVKEMPKNNPFPFSHTLVFFKKITPEIKKVHI